MTPLHKVPQGGLLVVKSSLKIALVLGPSYISWTRIFRSGAAAVARTRDLTRTLRKDADR
jgi:hypothetical protein